MGAIADLIQRQGENTAAGLRENGRIYGQLGQQLGAIPGQTYAQIQQAKQTQLQQAETAQRMKLQSAQIDDITAQQHQRIDDDAAKQKQAAADDATNQFLQSARIQDPTTGVWTYDRSKLAALQPTLGSNYERVTKILDEGDANVAKGRAAHAEAIKNMAALVDATGNSSAVFKNEVQRGIDNKSFTAAEAAPYLAAVARDPEHVSKITQAILHPGEERKLIPTSPTGFSDAQSGAQVTPPTAPVKPPVEDESAFIQRALSTAATKKGSALSPAEQNTTALAARKDWLAQSPTAAATAAQTGQPAQQFDASRPDPKDPKSNKMDPSTGLTPNSLYQTALGFALQNTMPQGGRASVGQVQNARNALTAKASAMAASAGVDLPTLRAEYSANKKSLDQIVPRVTFTAGAMDAANDNLKLALDLAPGVGARGSVPSANRFAQWFRGELTDAPDLSQFETAIYTAAREYAKVTSGAAQSVAGLSDSATKEAEKLLNAAKAPKSFEATVKTMQADMANVQKENLHQVDKVSGTIAGFLSAQTGVPVGEGKTPQVTPSTELPPASHFKGMASGPYDVPTPDGKSTVRVIWDAKTGTVKGGTP